VVGANLSDWLRLLVRDRQTIFGAVFAAFISSHAALVLLFGLTGSLGNAIFTGLFLSLTTAVIWFLTFRNDFAVSALDYLFAGLVAVIVSSVLSNGLTAEPKEYVLLILTLSAYPACRFIRVGDLTRGRHGFDFIQAVLVLIGTAATVAALVGQWNGFRAKPIILGFDGAAIYFLQSLSYLVFSVLIARQLTAFRAFLFFGLLIVPMAIFAASFVRFVFIALIATLFIATYLRFWQRKNILIVVAAIVLGVAVGSVSRSAHVVRFLTYAVGADQVDLTKAPQQEDQVSRAQTAPSGATKTDPSSGTSDPSAVPVGNQATRSQALAPSCSTDANVNLQNSLAIRKVLLHDAAFMLPSAGLFGHGLDAFMRKSCLAGHQIHNSFLQAFVEFGWLGGILFIMLVVKSLWSILKVARRDAASRFVFCCLTFVVLLCLAHGRFSREAVVFAWIGTVAGMTQSARVRSPVTQPAQSFVSRLSG
jgi:hypothetical protein